MRPPEIKNRGVDDVCIVVGDGLTGLPESIEASWPLAIVQTDGLHLIRSRFHLASRADRDTLVRNLRPDCIVANEADAQVRLEEFHDNGATATRQSAPCGPTVPS